MIDCVYYIFGCFKKNFRTFFYFLYTNSCISAIRLMISCFSSSVMGLPTATTNLSAKQAICSMESFSVVSVVMRVCGWWFTTVYM